MTRFSIIPGNPCAILDRCEGSTYQTPSAAEALRLLALLQLLEEVAVACDTTKVFAVRNALEDLVAVKAYKDTNGKDTYYEQAKEEAWEAAQAALLM